MAARAYWKGHLRLSLVTIGVELYSAVDRSSRLSLRQIHGPSGERVRYDKVVPGIGPIDTADIVKGFEVEKGEYVLLTPEDLDAIKLESKQTIDLVQFVDICEIDPRYFDRPYYVVPAENEVAEEGFAVIRDALRAARRTALGQMATRGRDYIVAIRPCGKGLLLETLRYAEEVRESERIFNAIGATEVDEEMLDLARELIERKSAPFDAERFASRYAEALRELIEEKRKKGSVASPSAEERPEGGQIVDLMEALKKSVSGGKSSGRRAKKKSAPRSRKTSAKKGSRKKRAAS